MAGIPMRRTCTPGMKTYALVVVLVLVMGWQAQSWLFTRSFRTSPASVSSPVSMTGGIRGRYRYNCVATNTENAESRESKGASGAEEEQEQDDEKAVALVRNFELLVKGAMDIDQKQNGLESKLMDKDIAQRVLGDTSEEERDIMRQIEDSKGLFAGGTGTEGEGEAEGEGEESAIDISALLGGLDLDLADLRAEAKQAMSEITGPGPGPGAEAAVTAPPSAMGRMEEEEEEEAEGEGEGEGESEGEGGRRVEGNSAELQSTFAALLKATMDTTQTGGADQENQDLVSSTVSAVQQSNLETLDVRSILGQSLTMLTEALDIDMEKELAQSATAKEDMQNIMKNGLSELASNMRQLDQESQALYDKLERLKQEVLAETERFEEEKQEELDYLLSQQGALRTNYTRSQEYLRDSTAKLEALMKSVTEDAGILTTLALFPTKSLDRKLAFVVGLALLLKVPFDSTYLFSLRSSDPSDWLTILTQSLVCLACFNHFGLIRAIANEISGKGKERRG